jgi:Iron-containing redox enzyme
VLHPVASTSPLPPTSGESARLRRKIELVLPALLDASRRLTSHPRIAKLYPEYLFMTHCVIRASVPLMETAHERAERLASGDPAARALALYLEKHVPEERDHDAWLLDDAAAIGLEPAAMLARPPSPSVAAVVGAQYYWILHYHPVALLGYIAVLEGYPPSPELVEGLVARIGLGRDAFRTIAAHAELDPGHRDELDAMLDGLSLTPEQSAAVGLSAMYTVQMLGRALDEISDGAG